MKSVEFFDWETWFGLVCEETKRRESVECSNEKHEADADLIQAAVDRLCADKIFDIGWNFSFEISETLPLFWFTAYNLEVVSKNLLQSLATLPETLKLDWLFRVEIYPQIRDGIKYGDSACLEFISTKTRCIAWAEPDNEVASGWRT